jgi:hypothetical protein
MDTGHTIDRTTDDEIVVAIVESIHRNTLRAEWYAAWGTEAADEAERDRYDRIVDQLTGALGCLTDHDTAVGISRDAERAARASVGA